MKPTTCKPFILETHNTRTLIFADGLVETLLLSAGHIIDNHLSSFLRHVIARYCAEMCVVTR